MSEVDVPKVGKVGKKPLMIVGGLGAAFVLYRYYQSRQAAASAAATDTSGTFGDAGSIPSVSGTALGGYGLPADTSTTVGSTVGSYGFSGTTNDQWTQYAADQLIQSETWSYTDIVGALGNYLSGKALTSAQVTIVQAAIAVAGYPPVGQHPVISGGDTGNLVAPSGLRVTAVSQVAATLVWNTVPGASGYHMYRNGVAVGDTGSPGGTITGLAAGTSYSVTVAAYNVAGVAGPHSGAVSVKTQAATKPPVTKPPAKPPVKPPAKPPAKAPGKPAPKPAPPVNRFPKFHDWYVVVGNTNYTAIAHSHGLNLSGQELWEYQFSSSSPHSAAAKTKLHQQGPNLILHGQSIAIPYNK